MKKLDILAAVLVAVGGINWGLVAARRVRPRRRRSSASSSARRTPSAGSSTGSSERRPSTRSPSSTRSGAAGAVTPVSQPPNSTRSRKETTVPTSFAHSRKPLALALAGATAVAALLALSLGNSPGAAAAPAAQQNIVHTAAAAGQFKTLLSLAKQAGLVGALSGTGPADGLRSHRRRLQGRPEGDARQARQTTAPHSGASCSTTSSRATSRPRVWSSCDPPKTLAGPAISIRVTRRVRLPQRLDESRQDRHRREQRNDPRHQQGAAAARTLTRRPTMGREAHTEPLAPSDLLTPGPQEAPAPGQRSWGCQTGNWPFRRVSSRQVFAPGGPHTARERPTTIRTSRPCARAAGLPDGRAALEPRTPSSGSG